MPPLLRQALQWLEEHGCVRRRADGSGYATLYPSSEQSADAVIMAFLPPDAADTRAWTGSDDPCVNARLSLFLCTGGDGSYAGLWLDDDGRQHIVHLGSGSGSVMLCVLVDSVEDLLRLLAIGYDELCWPEQFPLTPEEVREQNDDDEDDDLLPPPLAFRRYLETTLGLSVPPRASNIVGKTASMDDPASSDPFWNWLKQVRPDRRRVDSKATTPDLMSGGRVMDILKEFLEEGEKTLQVMPFDFFPTQEELDKGDGIRPLYYSIWASTHHLLLRSDDVLEALRQKNDFRGKIDAVKAVLGDEILPSQFTELGNEFAQAYYRPGWKYYYLKDSDEAFWDYDDFNDVPDTIENYEKVAALLDDRFRQWRSEH